MFSITIRRTWVKLTRPDDCEARARGLREKDLIVERSENENREDTRRTDAASKEERKIIWKQSRARKRKRDRRDCVERATAEFPSRLARVSMTTGT